MESRRTMFNAEGGTDNLQKRYDRLTTKRSAFLDRARKCSALSIPSLIPYTSGTDGQGNGESFEAPWQSMAARCVNNLASKLMMVLLPPNTPFFRLLIQPNALPPRDQRDPDMDAELDRGLSKMERMVVEYSASGSDRVVIHEALKHLIVGGNALLYLPPVNVKHENKARCYHLSDYVVRRAPNGDVLEIIVKESVSLSSLPQFVQEKIRQQEEGERTATDDPLSNFNIVTLYTGIVLDEKKGLWRIHQECKGFTIPDSDGTYPLDACPWIPMRFIRVDGEDYGRSYIEEYYGDIKSLDALYEALIQGSGAAAKVLFLVNPNGTTRVEDLSETPNLGFVSGLPDDVMALQINKYADFRVAREMIGELESRLSHAFILNTAIQRQGERVTAEEIRKMAEDLEAALGGVYSLLAVEFQLPYASVRLKQLGDAGVLPELPEGLVKPSIVTGVEALGRGNDKTKLLELGQSVTQILGPKAMSDLVNPTEYIRRLLAASGIDEGNLIVSPEELQERRQQAMQMQLLEKLGPNAVTQMGNAMKDLTPEQAQEVLSNNEQVAQVQQG